jgi:hypothetical protein
MVSDNPLILIDEETLTYYCHGCHTNTQNVSHTCEGQKDRVVKQTNSWTIRDIIYGF